MLALNTLLLRTAYCQEATKAIKLIQKEKVESAEKYLGKLFEKDSINPEYFFSYSIIYLIDTLPKYNVELSYQYITTAIQLYNEVEDIKLLQKFAKEGVDSTLMVYQKSRIEAAAFEEVRIINTEDRYNYFLKVYRENEWSDTVVVLRNKVAFQSALKENTYSSYRKFMETYPKASEIEEARTRFERLYFDENTKDKKLSSYVNFLKKHPETPYREFAEKQILKLSTLSGSFENFLQFITDYPKSKWVKTASDYVFHLNRQNLPQNLLSDSLNNIIEVDQKLFFPIYKFGLYGFITEKGVEVIPPKFTHIASEYTCKATGKDFLLVSAHGEKIIINTLGTTLWKGDYEQVIDLGNGILWIKHKDTSTVLHKSGVTIIDGHLQDVKLINNQLLAVQQNKKWGLYSLLGHTIFEPQFQGIEGMYQYVILTKKDNHAVTTIEQIAQTSRNPLRLNYIYTDFEMLKSNNLYVESSNIANILNSKLAPMLPLTTQEITFIPSGIIVKKDNSNMLYSYDFQLITENQFFNYVYNKDNLFINKNEHWQKIDEEAVYDTAIILSDHISLGLRHDTITFFLQQNRLLKSAEEVFRIIRDHGYHEEKESFLVFTENNLVEVYNLLGLEIFKGKLEKINALGPNLIVIQQHGKKGVIDAHGNTIVPLKMDAIANYNNGSFSILSNSTFGRYNKDSTYISPEYDRALKPYNDTLLIAYKDNGYGLIHTNNEPITHFEFEEIRYWNDTSALVKQNYEWKIYDFTAQEALIENIKHIEDLSNTSDEIIMKLLIDNNYGVYSNTRGIIVPSSFSDIIDIGSNETPLYLAERNIEEANFYVTIYYNNRGEIIYKQAYEGFDYQKVYCDSK
ncbi:MAG: WG repeat-containing protein [Cyclobacteriaceae bacterium]|nr:WG repeat-containing protein [Cyclobacteriaceae bacterium]